ncbi:MAG: hypothetical protein ABR529_03355 [Actinomycetota bacterium]
MRILRSAEETCRGTVGRLAALLGAAALLLAGCGQDGDGASAPSASGNEESTSAGELGAEEVDFGASLAQIRAHHLVSLDLYEAGRFGDALLHATHPIDELLAAVQGGLEEHDAGVAGALEQTLRRATTAIQERVAPAKLGSIYARAAALTENGETSVVGAETTAYRASVVASLSATAAREYEEAVGKDGLRLEAEYQDGYAFVQEARRLYQEIAATVEDEEPEEAEEIEEAFAGLAQALPSPTPPQRLASVEDVEVAARLIGAELEEVVGARVEGDLETDEIGEEIDELLDEIVATYEAGDADEAAELSAEAYLENYEVIEAEVIEQAPDINEELEPLLGAELRRRIQDGAPATEIEAMVERAKKLLDKALAVLDEAVEHS